METAAYFRRQAGFLLRLGRSCTDKSVIRNLERMAAEFHEKAIEAEFNPGRSGPRAGVAPSDPAERSQ